MIDVLVVGAGPVGLHAAAEFAARGFDVELWERRERPPASKAIGVHAPALKALAGIGVTEAMLAESVFVRRGHGRRDGRTLGTVDFGVLGGEHPYVATLPQYRTEALLAERAPSARRRELRGLELEGEFVRAVADVGELRARFVVLADGARGRGAEFIGARARRGRYPDRFSMIDVTDRTGDGDDAVIHLHPAGVVESFPLPGGVRRYVVGRLDTLAAPAIARAAEHRTGDPVDASTVTMVSRFQPRLRLVDRMVRGRVALVGDAAHEISPIGGQGMNLGWLDVAGLVPRVAHALEAGERPDLDAWQRRRMTAARRAARQSGLNTALGRPGRSIGARGTALGLMLATPLADHLARVYGMRGLD